MGRKNKIVKLEEGIYQIRYYWLGVAEVYAYLILGKEKGLLIDTCYSVSNIKDYVKQVTDLPVDVVNTHGHFDHIGGNAQFERIFLSEKDWMTVKQHSDYDYIKKMMNHFLKINPVMGVLLKVKRLREEMEASMHIQPVKYRALPECGFFELGARKVSFIETPGHTQGSICLFDEVSQYFFVGDMSCEEGVLLGFDHSTGVAEYRESIRKMKYFYEKNHGKVIMPSHHKCPAGNDIFDRYIEVCSDIISGKLNGKYQDQGMVQGKVVKACNLQIVYQRI